MLIMSKTIAIFGSPGCGKTITSVKMASALSRKFKDKSVIVVSPDYKVPTLSYIFPNSSTSWQTSIGELLDLPEIYKEDILSYIVMPRKRDNFGILGYKRGDSLLDYVSVDEDKAIDLIKGLKDLADFVIFDCTDYEEDVISKLALTYCDIKIRIANPDIKSLGYFIAKGKEKDDRSINIINEIDEYVYSPDEEIKEYFGGKFLEIPLSKKLRLLVNSGMVLDSFADKEYERIIEKIAMEVVKG